MGCTHKRRSVIPCTQLPAAIPRAASFPAMSVIPLPVPSGGDMDAEGLQTMVAASSKAPSYPTSVLVQSGIEFAGARFDHFT